jgi:dihydrofolate synthase/folylpolyglutamate synthase
MSDPVGWLYSLQHSGIKLGLDNIRALLDLLGHPQRAYASLLIAGTNGKGSVAAMLESMLSAHGIRAGMFTSPHLVRPTERVRIGGEDISGSQLDRLLVEMRARIERGVASGALAVVPSFFETITAAALQAFEESGVECAVLEVGMGGRLDATNAVDAAMGVVVTIDYDHVEHLGDTLERIAAEKAAIVKPGRPLVSGVVQDEARAVLRAAAERAGATLVEARQVAALSDSGDGRFEIRTAERTYGGLTSPLLGRHQRDNARVAIVALEALGAELGFTVDAARVREGLAGTRWPGRLQWITAQPPLLLDGAHNPAGAAVLAEFLDAEFRGRRAVLLFGALENKEVEGIVRPLAGRVDSIVITRARVERAAEPEDLARRVRPLAKRVEIVPDMSDALTRARALALPDGFVLVAGSLYLVGEVLGLLEGGPVPGPVSM